ncbi:MAG: hypothetical protein P4L92_02665 [Rudaea sp.]|nr:hypothetical protein [Rudaea sp.]
MKTLIKACFAFALIGFAAGVLASPTIELKDGSRITGEIQSLDKGVYTILSPSIGTVHVAQSNIVRIVYSGDVSNAAGSSGKSPMHDDAMTHNIQQLQASLAQDPATIQSIMSLQSDPQIQAVLSDPAIMKAVQEGDFTSLLGNPKIQALESNVHLKQLVEQQEH